MPDTFIDEMESIVDEVARWGADYVKDVIDILAPDGRPFGGVPKSTDEQLEEYRAMRNDTEAWKLWIQAKSDSIKTMLLSSGIPEEHLGVINPLQIASQFCLAYSIKMEKLLEERMVT